MTTALDLRPAPGHPGAAVASVHEALDAVGEVSLEPGEYAEVVRDVERAVRRLEALKLRLVAAAGRASVPEQAGARSTGSWLATHTRSGSAQGARDARLADDLDDRLTRTRDALAEGRISTRHASVIAHATSRLPHGLTLDQQHRVEQSLVEKARRLDPAQLRRVARRALEEVEPDASVVDAHEDALVAEEELDALAAVRLTLHDHDDGTTSGHFRVPTLAATMLRKVLDAMTAPRRSRPGPSGLATHPARARGLAFAQVLEHLPTDHLHGPATTQVTVVMDYDTLLGRLKATDLDTDRPISAGEARRMVCNSTLTPAVLGRALSGKSLVLDLGRLSRLFTDAQRRAIHAVHTHCAARGCTRPIAWCELHHRTAWAKGGRTDLPEAVPLCGWHHRRIHDHRYLHDWHTDGTVSMRLQSWRRAR